MDLMAWMDLAREKIRTKLERVTKGDNTKLQHLFVFLRSLATLDQCVSVTRRPRTGREEEDLDLEMEEFVDVRQRGYYEASEAAILAGELAFQMAIISQHSTYEVRCTYQMQPLRYLAFALKKGWHIPELPTLPVPPRPSPSERVEMERRAREHAAEIQRERRHLAHIAREVQLENVRKHTESLITARQAANAVPSSAPATNVVTASVPPSVQTTAASAELLPKYGPLDQLGRSFRWNGTTLSLTSKQAGVFMALWNNGTCIALGWEEINVRAGISESTPLKNTFRGFGEKNDGVDWKTIIVRGKSKGVYQFADISPDK